MLTTNATANIVIPIAIITGLMIMGQANFFFSPFSFNFFYFYVKNL